VREKQARVEASIKEREKEVQQSLASSLRERDKERDQHKKDEAVQHFKALLVDMVTRHLYLTLYCLQLLNVKYVSLNC